MRSKVVEARQEVGAARGYLSEAKIEWLEQLYTFREREDVLWFLERYPFLVSLLLEASGKIGSYFPDSQLFLEVFTDPETINHYQLVISIATNLAPNEAVERLEWFDEDWWLDALYRAQEKLCINVEFR